MRTALFSSALLTALCALAQAKTNYDGHRVVRVRNTDQVKALIERHGLDTWGSDHGNIDVVVPPGLSILEEGGGELDPHFVTTMHRNLGRSIAEEGQYEVYKRGKVFTHMSQAFEIH